MGAEGGSEKPKNTRQDKLLLTAVIVGLVLTALLVYVIIPKVQEDRAAQEPTATPTAPDAQAPSFLGTTPTATPTPTKAPTYSGSDADHERKEGNAGFTPTSDRKPASSDAADAKKVISEVMPRWAGIDFTGNGQSPDLWAKDIARDGGVDSTFSAWSQTRFYDLWSGVLQMHASAKVTDVSVDKELWNEGSHSMWRVTVTRDIVSNDDRKKITDEKVSWDILVSQDNGEDGFELVYFDDPDKSHEKPDTFYQPPLP